jgi:hypothetical protein
MDGGGHACRRYHKGQVDMNVNLPFVGCAARDSNPEPAG